MSDVETAQKRLATAALKMPMNPAGAGISGYVNSLLLRAKVDALVEVIANPPNASWTMQEAIDAAMARQLNERAAEMESKALQMTLAQSADEGARIALSS